MTSIPFLLFVRLLVALAGFPTHASFAGASPDAQREREAASWQAPTPTSSWERHELRDSEVSILESSREDSQSSFLPSLALLGAIFDSALLSEWLDRAPCISLKSGVLHPSSRLERPPIRAPPPV